jgi:hypothetical protein
MKLGTIPERIKIYARPETEMRFKFDDIEVDDFQKTTRCCPIFVACASNPKTQKTALEWASRPEYTYVNRQTVRKDHTPVVTERANDPIRNIRLIGLEHRGNGGRAYKALIDDTYVFDFREDVLLDAILNDGILPDGILPGEYIFSSVNSEMKLIRVGSLLHAKMVAATAYWSEKVITKFEVGGVYKNKVSELLYLGTVYTSDITVTWPQASGYYRGDNRSKGHLSASLDKPKKFHLFVEYNEWKRKDPSYYDMKFYEKLPKSFRIKSEHISINPEDYISDIKKKTITCTSDSHLNMWFENYARFLNISSAPGYVHPSLQRFLTK